jgi:deoxyribodipyrimidine photo-lyase
MEHKFVTDHSAILSKLDTINPVKYAHSRNYVNGQVNYLSPYISRGVISTKQVLASLLSKGHSFDELESLMQQLCWRDYFQRIAQVKDINQEIKQSQENVEHQAIPLSIMEAKTGIQAIDQSIESLFETGYMHNHSRLYLATLTCNIGKSYWLHPAKWMYYHLLDGDWASNACSWQWVAGANSSKKYFANQENINKYTASEQQNTYLDTSYDVLSEMEIPGSLTATQKFNFELTLPETSHIQFIPDQPTFIYNYYNLDPLWHKDEPGNRILLIEPEFFQNYPVSKKCMDFMLDLSKNIPGIQIYVGSFQSFSTEYKETSIYYKEHPLNIGYFGVQEERDWITADVVGYYPSFFAYWKKVRKHLKFA